MKCNGVFIAGNNFRLDITDDYTVLDLAFTVIYNIKLNLPKGVRIYFYLKEALMVFKQSMGIFKFLIKYILTSNNT